MKTRSLFIVFLLITGLLGGCSMTKKNDNATANKQVFFVGTYTGGGSQGIYAYTLAEDGKMDSLGLAAPASNPSFLAKSKDGKYLLAISEIGRGQEAGFVNSYLVKNDTLLPLSTSTSGGAHPCFVSINEEGAVLVANYTGGNIGLLSMDSEGNLSDLLDLQQHEGSGPTQRQMGPHAHSAWFDPVNGFALGVDLGTDDVWVYRVDMAAGKLLPTEQKQVEMAPGAGPRHLDFHPNGKWIYVLNELNATVSMLGRDTDSSYIVEQTIGTLPEDFTDKNKCADIHVSPDGKYVYASNRGHNSIAIFSVNQENGYLHAEGHVSTGGETPRNFAISPDGKYLLVANKDSDNILSFLRDPENGQLQKIDEVIAPSPVCILF